MGGQPPGVSRGRGTTGGKPLVTYVHGYSGPKYEVQHGSGNLVRVKPLRQGGPAAPEPKSVYTSQGLRMASLLYPSGSSMTSPYGKGEKGFEKQELLGATVPIGKGSIKG
ncbi:MAG: hypothetical protein CME71_11785 [Halobacteriovorax sp.]|nr:hypothetical protein [Halobacteriovorax sp.]|tara:strand:- start:1116 stop:1445 length:330 start_codon:yes stop_codon:yes gene_type:complete